MKLFNFKKAISYFTGEINAPRDWKFVLGGFILLLIIVFSIDGYTFWKYQKELSGQVEGGETKFVNITINKTSLQKVIDEINIKERKFNEYLISPPTIKDPSE